MTVGEMRERMSAKERQEWVAYFTWQHAINNKKEVV